MRSKCRAMTCAPRFFATPRRSAPPHNKQSLSGESVTHRAAQNSSPARLLIRQFRRAAALWLRAFSFAARTGVEVGHRLQNFGRNRICLDVWTGVPRGKETTMPGQYDRNRDAEGRFSNGPRGGRDWDDYDDRGREDRGRRFGRGNDRPRDEQGRFTEERGSYYGQRGYDEDRYRSNDNGPTEDYGRYGREYEDYERGRDDYRRSGRDDDDRGERGRQQDDRGRDEYGRFTSDDDYRGRRGYEEDQSGMRSRESRGRGWFGDPQGHSEADRQRGRGGFRYDDDDNDRGGRGRSRGSGRERDEQGRFMGSDDDDGNGRGGRSESRGGDRERDEQGRFMGSDDDDDNGRGGRSRSRDDNRGWFGDSRRHAAAARLGWRHRQD